MLIDSDRDLIILLKCVPLWNFYPRLRVINILLQLRDLSKSALDSTRLAGGPAMVDVPGIYGMESTCLFDDAAEQMFHWRLEKSFLIGSSSPSPGVADQ
jgi:hypothetical protein